MRSGRLAILVSIVVCSGGLARAGDSRDDEMRKLIFDFRIEKVADLLEKKLLPSVGTDPGPLHDMGWTIENWGNEIMWADPKAAGRVFDLLHARAVETRAAHPDDDRAKRAWAFLTAARARHRLFTGYKKPQPEWVEAAEIMAASVEPEDPLRGARWLVEAAANRAEDADALLARSQEIVEQVLAKDLPDSEKAATRARACAWRAAMWIARKDRGAAKKEVARGLAYLEPHLGSDKPEVEVAHTKLATVAHVGSLKMKGADYRTRQEVTSDKALAVDVPLGSGWTREKSNLSKSVLKLVLRGPDDATRITLGIVGHAVSAKLRTPSGGVIGLDNTKNMARQFFPDLAAVTGLAEVIDTRKPKKVKLDRSLGNVWESIIVGRMEEADRWRRSRIYYVRADEHQRVYMVTISEYVDEPELDPTASFILGSLRQK